MKLTGPANLRAGSKRGRLTFRPKKSARAAMQTPPPAPELAENTCIPEIHAAVENRSSQLDFRTLQTVEIHIPVVERTGVFDRELIGNDANPRRLFRKISTVQMAESSTFKLSKVHRCENRH